MNMKRFRKSLMVILLAGVMAAPTVLAAPSSADIKRDKEKAQGELSALQGRLQDLMQSIDKTERELISTGEAIQKAEDDLAEAEEREKEQYASMKERIVTMYENGNSSMVARIFKAGSIAEMIRQAQNVQTVHDYDRKQLDEYVKTKEKIASLKESLESDMAVLEERQKSFSKQKDELNNSISQLKSKVSNFDSQLAEIARKSVKGSSSSSKPSGSNYVPPVGTGGGAAIVSEAYKYLGIPYVWGGASMRGVDCSGLVLLAHRAIGVNLSHSSGAIGVGGRAVSAANAQPGDVVCYSGHVAIYLGNGMMIHAPQRGDVVRVVKVYGSPWYRRYW